MADMTYLESEALGDFSQAFEMFIQRIENHCSKMENGISYSRAYMKDPVSEKAFDDTLLICTNIRSVLNPAKLVLEKTIQMKKEMDYSENLLI